MSQGRIFSSLALIALSAAACGSPTGSARAPLGHPTTTAPLSSPEPPPQYVLAQTGGASSALRISLPSGGVAFLSSGARVVLDKTGKLVGMAKRTESLIRADAIPEWLGGGFLFTAGDALFRSHDFLGDLEPLAASSSGFVAVTFGPTSALVITNDGERFSLQLPSGERGKVEPKGAIVLGSLSGTRGVAIEEGGLAYLTTDAGKSWSSLASKLSGAPIDIVADEPLPGASKSRGIFVIEDNGGALRIDDTTVSRAGTGPRAKTAPRPVSSRGEPYLDLAMKSGAPLDDPQHPREALVADAGSLFTIDLETGDIVSVERGVLPPDLPCQVERFSGEVLVLCRQSNRAAVASRPILGGKVTLEATFQSAGTFVRGAGDTLLYTAACKGDASKPGQACLRVPRTDNVEAAIWSDIDRAPELSDADPKKPVSIVAWVPGEKGATIVLGGADGGLLDTRGHTRTHLSEDETRKLEQVFRSSGNDIVERRFQKLADGVLEGWNPSNVGVRVSGGGKTIEVSPFAFSGARIAGPKALSRSPQSTLWQSNDWGQTFVEVASPDIAGPPESPRDCSDVGCNLGEWLRIGWEPRAPLPPKIAEPPTRRVVSAQAPPSLPFLSCLSTGVATRKAVPLPDSGRGGFGIAPLPPNGPELLRTMFARAVPVTGFESASLRAMLLAKQPTLGPDGTARLTDVGTDRRIFYIDAFDPKAVEKHASIRLDAIVSSVTTAGGSPPDLATTEESGTAVPVLSDAGGLVLTGGMSGPPLWVRDTHVTPLSFGADGTNLILSSVIESKPDELLALVTDESGSPHVRRLARGVATELFSIPAAPSVGRPQTPDALAIASDGSLGVIRVPTAAAPTAESPAFLLRAGKEPVTLAPWSTISSADDPACSDGKGYRALVVSRRSWLALTAGQPDEDHVGLVRVRWSEERVCLEAGEIQALTHDLPAGQVESYVAFRLGKEAAAGHVLVGSGVELREPRTCSLGHAAIR